METTTELSPVSQVYFRQDGKYYEERSGHEVTFAEVLASVQRGRKVIDKYRGRPATRPNTDGREWIA